MNLLSQHINNLTALSLTFDGIRYDIRLSRVEVSGSPATEPDLTEWVLTRNAIAFPETVPESVPSTDLSSALTELMQIPVKRVGEV
jgi:hypothetical protein